MYTTFIIDEIGNRKIIMDWRGSPRFSWNEVKVGDLLSEYPNHCAGLKFAHFWTGDDWHSQNNIQHTPEFGYLPNFLGVDLPSPRTILDDTGPHTRISGDKSAPSYLPVEIPDQAFDLQRGKPRIRCTICAWNLGHQAPFCQKLPNPKVQPPTPPEPDNLAIFLRQIISKGATTRRELANMFTHKNRWRDLDRWLEIEKKKKDSIYLPTEEKCRRLLSNFSNDVVVEALEAINKDISISNDWKEWLTWEDIYEYPDWASVVLTTEGKRYHHHYCGRDTDDLSEVLSTKFINYHLDERNITILQENWKNKDQHWISFAISIDEHLTSEDLSTLEKKLEHSLIWNQTERFYFGITQRLDVL